MSSATGKKSSSGSIPSGLPTEAFRSEIIDTNEWRAKMPTEMMQRPGFGKLGKPAQIAINSHVVNKYPTKDIFQYDVGFQQRSLAPAPAKLFSRSLSALAPRSVDSSS